MRVDAHVPCGAAEALALAVGDVLFRLWITVLFRHAEVNDMDKVRVFRARAADEKVVRLDVSVDEVTVLDRLHTRNLRAKKKSRKRETNAQMKQL